MFTRHSLMGAWGRAIVGLLVSATPLPADR
jgi:hypothetical protein